MATKLDSANLATKGGGCGNTTGLFSYSGKLFYACTKQVGTFEIYVQVWVYSGGTWTSYDGPEIFGPPYIGVGGRAMVSADAYTNSLWIAYSVSSDANTHAIDIDVVRFDMDTLTYDSAITSFTPSISYAFGEQNAFFHSDAPSSPTKISRDYPTSHLIYATSGTAFRIVTQYVPPDTFANPWEYTHLEMQVAVYSGSGWTYGPMGREAETSDLIAAKLTNGAGPDYHTWFYSWSGAGLYHQQHGSGPSLVASDLAVITPWDVSAGVYPARGVAVGKPIASGSTIYLPYKSSSGALKLATYSSGSWSTETVDSSETPYEHYTPASTSVVSEWNSGNFCAAYILSGTLEVLWWDNANNQATVEEAVTPVTQTLWRSRKVSGSWTAPVAVVADAAWHRDVDVAIAGSTLHIIYQRYDASAPAYLTPWHLSVGGSGSITVPSITAGTSFGAFSGIRGGVPSGDGCGSGPRLPSSAGRIYPRCSTYTAS